MNDDSTSYNLNDIQAETSGGAFINGNATAETIIGRDVNNITHIHYPGTSETNPNSIGGMDDPGTLFANANRLRATDRSTDRSIEALALYRQIKNKFPNYRSHEIEKAISDTQEFIYKEANNLYLKGKSSEALTIYLQLSQESRYYQSREIAKRISELEIEIKRGQNLGYVNPRGEVQQQKLENRFRKVLNIFIVVIIIAILIRFGVLRQMVETIKRIILPNHSIEIPTLIPTPNPVETPEMSKTEIPTPRGTPNPSIVPTIAPAFTFQAQIDALMPILTSQAQMDAVVPILTSQAQLVPILTSQAQMDAVVPILTSQAQLAPILTSQAQLAPVLTSVARFR